jgi:hypothetical protein
MPPRPRLAPRPGRPAPAPPSAVPRRRGPMPEREGSPLELQLGALAYQQLRRLANFKDVDMGSSRPAKGDVMAALMAKLEAEGVTELVRARLWWQWQPRCPCMQVELSQHLVMVARHLTHASAHPRTHAPTPQTPEMLAAIEGPASPKRTRAKPAPPPPAAGAAAEEEEVSREEILIELKKELASFSHAQLSKSLKDRGLSAQGSGAVLIDRLAEAVVAERWARRSVGKRVGG